MPNQQIEFSFIYFSRDRNQTALDNLRDCSPSPPAITGQNDPEMALNFLQQLDGKLAALSIITDNFVLFMPHNTAVHFFHRSH